jgi:hypothetical protein
VNDVLHAQRNFFQTSWVVRDLYTAMNRWIDNASVGPFYVFPRTRFQDATWHGVPVELRVDIAYAQVGSMQIELVMPLRQGAAVFDDPDTPCEAVLHHVAAYTDDLHSEIAHYTRLGLGVVLRATHRGTGFAYVDTRATLGCMTELIERRGPLPQVFDEIAATSSTWDGTVPMRYDFAGPDTRASAERWRRGPPWPSRYCPNPSAPQ